MTRQRASQPAGLAGAATPHPLWHRLLALNAVTVAPLLLFGAYAGSRMGEAQLDQIRKNLMSEARIMSAEIDRQTADETETLSALAKSPSLRGGDFAAFQRQAEAALPGRRSGTIVLVGRDMDQLLNTRVPYGTPLPKVAVEGPVEQALATGRPQFTGLFRDPVAGQPAVAVVVPVAIDGDNRYALVGSRDGGAFARLVAARMLPPGRRVAVTDAEHHVVAQAGLGEGAIGTTLPRPHWHQDGPAGLFAFPAPDGPAIEAYARSEMTGWETAVWEPEATLTAPLRALWRSLGWLALAAFALMAVLALWFGRLIAGAVAHAANAAAALVAGDPLPPGATPVTDVNTLVARLHEAAAQRQAAEERLRDSEATFRAMFDKSSVGKIEVEPETGRFLRANPAMCRFVGYSEEELRNLTVWDITYPEERERDREPIRRLLSGEAAEFDVEKRYVRKDGTPVWAHTTVNLVRDESSHPVRSFAVIQDIDARKRAEQALQAGKDRLELALEAARLGSWQYDARRRVFIGDARAGEIFGFDAAGTQEVPIEEITRRIHPDDVARALKVVEDALDPVEPRRAATQFRVRRRQGEIRWVETLGLAYFEGTGPARRGVSIVGTAQDITARKEREEKEHLLMREINHRAKNMLSVVHAIAHQTATRDPEDFIARFAERIQALSANQDLLIRNEWNGVDVGDLVRAQLAHFVGLIGTRIGLRGPRLRLRAPAAQAVGLALHELATNAGKYGALSSGGGRVDISWGTDGDTFAMSWIESGGRTVSPPQRRGFGAVVIEEMVERSVGGKVDLDYAPAGVTWCLACPAANALETGASGGTPEQGRCGTGSGPSGGAGGGTTTGSPASGARSARDPSAGGTTFFSAGPAMGEAGEGEGGAPHRPQFNTELRGR